MGQPVLIINLNKHKTTNLLFICGGVTKVKTITVVGKHARNSKSEIIQRSSNMWCTAFETKNEMVL